MARFLFVVPPATGHINPSVSLAHHLTERGHQVAWVGYPGKTRPLLPQGGALFALDEGDFARIEAEYTPLSEAARGLQSVVLFWERFMLPLGERMLEGVEEAISRFRPDVVVSDQQALAGAFAARRHSLPWATLVTTAASVLRRPVEDLPLLQEFYQEKLAQAQQRAGLEQLPQADRSPQLVLIFSSPELVGEEDFPVHYQFVGPSISARRQDVPFPWESLQERPRVLISLGTVNGDRGERFYQTAMNALGSAPWQVVLVAPPARLGNAPVPENFLVRDYVPQLALLPKVQAVVCHAGQNTVSEALAHGVPLVVLPIKDDQPVIASQVERAGVGIRLKFGRLRPAELHQAISRVLNEPSYRQAAERVRASFQAAGGAPRAAALLEALLPSPGPATPLGEISSRPEIRALR